MFFYFVIIHEFYEVAVCLKLIKISINYNGLS